MKINLLTRSLSIISLAAALAGCSGLSGVLPRQDTTTSSGSSSVRIVLPVEVEWEALNPARGEASPRAGTLWGDRNGEQPTGFLARFADGFSSPPHAHNVTYRAVVIDGGIHNDDPEAARMWMGNGSFWTQPMGEVHITAARGANNIALVDIDQGPYLVRPPEQAFETGERPVNLDASNVVWMPMSQQAGKRSDAHVSYLWGIFGGNDWNGSFVKLAAGFEGVLMSEGEVFHGVVIRGTVIYSGDSVKELTPGGYVGARGKTQYRIASGTDNESIIYIRTNGAYQVRRTN
jgi:hypothetical protein